jgi:hypothetical protein
MAQRPSNKKPGRVKSRAGFHPLRPFSDFFYVAASRPAQMTTDIKLLMSFDLGVNRDMG